MHLLLLISAALSSQFTGISSNAAVFKTSPLKVDVGEDAAVTAIPPSAGAWTTDVFINVSLTATAPLHSETANWIATAGDGDGYTTTTAIVFKDLENTNGKIKEGDTVYVHIMHSTDTVVAAYGTIKYTDGWWMSCDPIDEDSYQLTNVRIEGPKDEWTGNPAAVKLLLHNEEVTDFAGTTFQFKSDPLTLTTNAWSAEFLDFTDVTLDPAEGIWAYVSYGTGPTYEQNGINIAVKEAIARFTVVAAPTIALDTATVDLTFAPIAPLVWTAVNTHEIDVTITLADLTPVKQTIVWATGGYKLTAFDMTQFGRRLKGDELKFEVKYDIVAATHKGGHVLKKPVVVALTGEDPVAKFAVVAPEEIDLRTMPTSFDVTMKNTDSTAWTEDVYFFLTKNLRDVPPEVDDAKWKKATKDEGSNPLTYTLEGVTVASFTSLAEGDKVYVWIMHDYKAKPNAAGDGTVLAGTVAINVVQSQEKCDFTVTPASIDLSAKQKETIAVTQTDKTVLTLWPENVNILLSSTKQTPSAITVIVPTVRTGTSPNFVHTAADVDLKQIAGLPTGGKLYVYVHYLDAKGEDVYLTVPGEITIENDFPEPLFTIAPTEFDLKDGTTIDIVATQNEKEAKYTDDVYLLFSLGPSSDPTKITLKKKATHVAVTTPKALDTWKVAGFAPKTEFPTLAKGNTIYVYVLHGFKESPAAAGTVIAGDGRIAIKDTTPAAEFTVAPAKVDLQKATTAEVVVTQTSKPAWAGDVYFHYSLTEIATQPDDDKFVKATLATGTYKNTLTLDTLTGIKKGDTIHVYVKPMPAASGSNAKTGVMLPVPGKIAVEKSDPEEAAMGVSPLLSLLAAALLLLVKLF